MTDAMLKGRRALVTGSVQGIGLGIAQALARQGCAIVLHGLATPAQAQEARASVLEAGAPTVDAICGWSARPTQTGVFGSTSVTSAASDRLRTGSAVDDGS